MEEDRLLTIPEAAKLFGLSQTTLYKRVKRGQLEVKSLQVKGREVKKVRVLEMERVYGPKGKDVQVKKLEETGNFTGTDSTSSEDISLQVKQVIENFFEEKQAQLMKPLEEQALYRVGRMEQLVEHLEAEKETLRTENETLIKEISELKETIKALPDKSLIETLEKENEELNNRLDEKQKKSEQLQEGYKAEIETLKEEEKDYLATIEELKRQLEEEQNKSWWKKIFS